MNLKIDLTKVADPLEGAAPVSRRSSPIPDYLYEHPAAQPFRTLPTFNPAKRYRLDRLRISYCIAALFTFLGLSLFIVYLGDLSLHLLHPDGPRFFNPIFGTFSLALFYGPYKITKRVDQAMTESHLQSDPLVLETFAYLWTWQELTPPIFRKALGIKPVPCQHRLSVLTELRFLECKFFVTDANLPVYSLTEPGRVHAAACLSTARHPCIATAIPEPDWSAARSAQPDAASLCLWQCSGCLRLLAHTPEPTCAPLVAWNDHICYVPQSKRRRTLSRAYTGVQPLRNEWLTSDQLRIRLAGGSKPIRLDDGESVLS